MCVRVEPGRALVVLPTGPDTGADATHVPASSHFELDLKVL
jgi:hypothetical protein